MNMSRSDIVTIAYSLILPTACKIYVVNKRRQIIIADMHIQAIIYLYVTSLLKANENKKTNAYNTNSKKPRSQNCVQM